MARRRRGLESEAEQLAFVVVLQMLQTPRGRRALLVLALLAAIVLGAWWLWQREHVRHTPAGPTVRLATWNLHEFGQRQPNRPPIDLRRIAQVIRDNRFDLLCLQEVRGAGEEVDHLLNVLGPPWRAAHYSPTTGNHERFVFLYDADHVQEAGPAKFVDDPAAAVFQRPHTGSRVPYQGAFRAGSFEFTVVDVHLQWTIKSQREDEMRALVRIASGLESALPHRHVIVVGDFNEEHAHPNLHYFQDQGWKPLIHEPTNLSSTEDFDNFVIDPRYTTEWSGQAGVVRFDEIFHYGSRKEAVEEVSDHRPAWADFVTTTISR